MREAEHFDYYRNTVLPYLANMIRDKDLRIWCCASSTGEEAYTLAMIQEDFFGRDKYLWDTKVLATDISEKVLNTAKKGVYENEHIASLPNSWKRDYFNSYTHTSSKVTDRIKHEVIFRRFNLMEPVFPYKKKFHVIFCRNVMIYFDKETKIELVRKLYNHMEEGGYLFIGQSESLMRDTTDFKYIMPSVYRKI